MHSRYITISDVLNTASFRDPNGASKMGLYTSFIKSIMNDLKFYVLKNTVTKKYRVDKKNNTIKIPNDCQLISAIGYEDECGAINPLDYNKNVPIGLQFEDAIKCDCGCGCNQKCKEVKVSQTVVEDIDMGGGITMQQTTTISTNNNNDIVKKIKYPVAYLDVSGEISFKYEESTETVCKLELKECGCLADTETNKVAVKNACDCIGTFSMKCGEQVCSNAKALGYNISYQGDLIVLPRGFDYDNLVIKYYPLIQSEIDYKIPELALECFMMGLKFYESRNELKSLAIPQYYSDEYQKEIKKLERRITKSTWKVISDSLGYIPAHSQQQIKR